MSTPKKKRTIRTPAQRLADMRKDMAKLEAQVEADEQARIQRIKDKAERLEATFNKLEDAAEAMRQRAMEAEVIWQDYLREHKEDLS